MARPGTILARLVAMAGFIALAVPGLFGAAEARPYDDVMEAGEVRIVVYRDFPPFASTPDGAPDEAMEGLEVDLAGIIADHLGVALHLMPLAADETVDDDLRNAVWLGPRISREVGDIMLHVPHDRRLLLSPSILDQRNEMVALFAPYYREQLVIARHEATMHLDTVGEDRIGVELDSMADFVMTGAFGGLFRENTRRFRTFGDARKALADGEIDGVMGPRSEVEWLLREVDAPLVISRPVIPRMGMTEWILGIAVREDSRDLGYEVQGLFDRMIADGSMARLFAKHGLTHVKPYDD